MNPDLQDTTSRLCSACGLCCNGVMFHRVRLQAGDSPAALTALGLKLKRRKAQHFLLQPCAAFQGTHCSIYTVRPERCRLFQCRQLKRVLAGEITEAMALERIREVQQRVAHVNDLLQQAGESNGEGPLAKRCENIMAEWTDPAPDADARELRQRLTSSLQELDTMLDEEFRIDPEVAPAALARSALGR